MVRAKRWNLKNHLCSPWEVLRSSMNKNIVFQTLLTSGVEHCHIGISTLFRQAVGIYRVYIHMGTLCDYTVSLCSLSVATYRSLVCVFPINQCKGTIDQGYLAGRLFTSGLRNVQQRKIFCQQDILWSEIKQWWRDGWWPSQICPKVARMFKRHHRLYTYINTTHATLTISCWCYHFSFLL